MNWQCLCVESIGYEAEQPEGSEVDASIREIHKWDIVKSKFCETWEYVGDISPELSSQRLRSNDWDLLRHGSAEWKQFTDGFSVEDLPST